MDPGLRCGFGSHQGATIAYVAQTGERTTPAGFRTATRLLGLAARLRLPVLTLIDTPGAAAAPADEAAGVGPAIAELFVAMASSQVPITSVVIGEGVSGGALALASPNDLWIARDGYLAVTAPELAVSILKLGAHDIPQVATWLRLTPAELMSRGIVRGIIAPARRASPVRRPTRGSRGPRGRRSRAMGTPARGQPHLHPAQGAGQREVAEIPEMADAEHPAGQLAQPGAERHVVVLQDQLAHLVRVVPVGHHDGGERARVVVRVLAHDLKSPAADRPAGRFGVPGVPGEDGGQAFLVEHGQGLAQPEQQVGGGRVGEQPGLARPRAPAASPSSCAAGGLAARRPAPSR